MGPRSSSRSNSRSSFLQSFFALYFSASLVFVPLFRAEADPSDPPNLLPEVLGFSDESLRNPDSFENQLLQDIRYWDPRVITGTGGGEHSLEYMNEELKKAILDSPPEIDEKENQWEKVQEKILLRASAVSEQLLKKLDETSFELGVTTLLKALRTVEIQRNLSKEQMWDKVVRWLNPSAAPKRPDEEVLDDSLTRPQLKQLRQLFDKYSGPQLRKLILEAASSREKQSEGDLEILHDLISEIGTSETARDLAANRAPKTHIPGLGTAEFSPLNGLAFVKFVLDYDGSSLLAIRKGHVLGRHLKTIVARQNNAAGPTDKWGRKLGRDTAVLIHDENGLPFSYVQYKKPEAWARRMQNYWYANAKGMSVWRTMFGVASGAFQAATTYYIATYFQVPNAVETAALSALFGTGIGANLAFYQNIIERGALAPISYSDTSFKNEKNIFKRLGKRLASIEVGPTLGSRYARSLYVTVSFAVSLSALVHWSEIHLTSLGDAGTSALLVFGPIAGRIVFNTWISNKGKTSIEELTRLLREKRVLIDNVKLGPIKTDIPKGNVLHQGLYNPTTNLFKLADYLAPKNGMNKYGLTAGNTSNAILETLMLRITARVAYKLDKENSAKYYRLYNSSILNVAKNWFLDITEWCRRGLKNCRGDVSNEPRKPISSIQRMIDSLSVEDAEFISDALEQISTQTDLTAEEREAAAKKVEDIIYLLYYEPKEKRWDQVSQKLAEKFDNSVQTARLAASAVVRPFAPEGVKQKLPKTNLSGLIQSCRSVLF